MRKEFTAKTKEAAAKRANGKCEECGRRLQYGEAQYDHGIPLALGGQSDLDNCRCLCKSCHLAKTTKMDVPTIAKAKRNFRRSAGIKKTNSRPFPCARSSPFKRKISGEVILRAASDERTDPGERAVQKESTENS